MLRCAVPELNSPHGISSFFSSFLVSSYDVCISERSNRLSSLDSGDRSCVCRLRLQHFRIPAGRAAARHGGKPQRVSLLHGTRYYRLCLGGVDHVAAARFERKKLLLFLLGLFAICHFAVLWVDSFWSLYATRIGVALAHSIFWSIMNPLAARMAPAGKRATGLAAVMGGTIVATVLGVPLGTKMGHLFGWAESFFVIGAAAFLVLMLLWYVLPQCPSRSAGSLKSLPVILKRPALLQLYGVTMITMLGQFTAYSFISPILEHSAGMSGSDVVDVLLLFGLAGIIGTVVSSKTVDRYPSASLTVPLVVLAMSLFLLVPLCSSWLSLVPLLLLWGAAQTAICMALSASVLVVASDAADVATSLYSGIFNIGIGGGAFVGSLVSQHFGFTPVAFVGGTFITISALFCLGVYFRTGSALLPHEDLSREVGEPHKL